MGLACLPAFQFAIRGRIGETANPDLRNRVSMGDTILKNID